jgi:hypothetical protein
MPLCSVFKKMFNPVDHLSRVLIIGDFRISLTGLKAAYAQFGVSTGIRFTDLQPDRNKMNVPPIERMTDHVR